MVSRVRRVSCLFSVSYFKSHSFTGYRGEGGRGKSGRFGFSRREIRFDVWRLRIHTLCAFMG